jgi:hypothetical protein
MVFNIPIILIFCTCISYRGHYGRDRIVVVWTTVLLVEETVVPGESRWQTLSHNVVSSTHFYYFVFWYFFSISFWFILMFFHLIILNIYLLFIATDLLLVIVNSCLERHLPHGLLFVIANSTSILHTCIEWFLVPVYDLCCILIFCVLIFFLAYHFDLF